jgi:hypothetical protein
MGDLNGEIAMYGVFPRPFSLPLHDIVESSRHIDAVR